MYRHLSMTTRRTTPCRCVPSDDIERMRSSLRHTYYSVPRELTLNEVDMILKPLFQNVNLDINVVDKRVHIVITNKPPLTSDFDTNAAIVDIINEWNTHDQFRRFLIKSLTNANKNKTYRYNPGVQWRCPMNVYYVFNPTDITDLTI